MQFGVKEFKDKENSLYVAVTLHSIGDAGPYQNLSARSMSVIAASPAEAAGQSRDSSARSVNTAAEASEEAATRERFPNRYSGTQHIPAVASFNTIAENSRPVNQTKERHALSQSRCRLSLLYIRKHPLQKNPKRVFLLVCYIMRAAR